MPSSTACKAVKQLRRHASRLLHFALTTATCVRTHAFTLYLDPDNQGTVRDVCRSWCMQVCSSIAGSSVCEIRYRCMLHKVVELREYFRKSLLYPQRQHPRQWAVTAWRVRSRSACRVHSARLPDAHRWHDPVMCVEMSGRKSVVDRFEGASASDGHVRVAQDISERQWQETQRRGLNEPIGLAEPGNAAPGEPQMHPGTDERDSDSATVSAGDGSQEQRPQREACTPRSREQSISQREHANTATSSILSPPRAQRPQPAAAPAEPMLQQRQPGFTLANAAQAAGVWNPAVQHPVIERLPTMSSASGSEPGATSTEHMQQSPQQVFPLQPLRSTAAPAAASPGRQPGSAFTGAPLTQPQPPQAAPHPQQHRPLTVLDLLALSNAALVQPPVPQANVAPLPAGLDVIGQLVVSMDAGAVNPFTALLRSQLLDSQEQAAQAATATCVTEPSTHSAATCAVPSGSTSAARVDTPPLTAQVHAVREARQAPTSGGLTHSGAFRPSGPAGLQPQPPSATRGIVIAAHAEALPSALDGGAGSGRAAALRAPTAAASAHNLAAPVHDRLLAVATPQAVPSASDAPAGEGVASLLNDPHSTPARLHFPQRPRTMPSMSAAAAGRAAGGRGMAGGMRATPLTPETRAACAQNLLAERLMHGPQHVAPPVRPTGGTAASSAVPLMTRVASESDSGRSPSGAADAAPVAVRRAGSASMTPRREEVELYLKVVAQLAALADGGVFGTWSCAMAEPRCCGARAVFRKALDLVELGVRPEFLAPLLRRHAAALNF
eukprot:jgi/Ulvmu1/12240/UM086_0031.1